MGGEIGGEQGAAPVAHGGEHRQHNAHGAAAEAGQVMDGRHLGRLFHGGHSFGITSVTAHYSPFSPLLQLTFSQFNAKLKKVPPCGYDGIGRRAGFRCCHLSERF